MVCTQHPHLNFKCFTCADFFFACLNCFRSFVLDWGGQRGVFPHGSRHSVEVFGTQVLHAGLKAAHIERRRFRGTHTHTHTHTHERERVCARERGVGTTHHSCGVSGTNNSVNIFTRAYAHTMPDAFAARPSEKIATTGGNRMRVCRTF